MKTKITTMTCGLTTDDEVTMASDWIGRAAGTKPPFSFCYDGRPSGEMLAGWQVRTEEGRNSAGDAVKTVTYHDPASGLECVIELTTVPGTSAVEWIVRFRNTGTGDSPILSDIQAMDFVRACPAKTPVILHHSKGTTAAIDDFALLRSEITHWTATTLQSCGSRAFLPFFNVELGGEGVIGGIGWIGKWRASFSRSKDGAVRMCAGTARTHFRLHAGEEVATPRMLLIFWKGDVARAHNLLRRHMVARHLPRVAGKVVEPPISCATWGGMKSRNHLSLIEFIRKNKLHFDVYWMDAGWYGPDHETEEFQNFHTEDWAYHIGHWRVNRMVHSDGLAPIVAAAAESGMKVLLWFSPYLAEESAPILREHPEAMLCASAAGGGGIGLNKQKVNLCSLNIGSPESRRFLADQISGLIREHKVEWFRDDGGLPLPREDQDAPDRQGIAEIRCVQGFYAFWDDLLKRHEGLLIDNCGGGATRIDLETLGRSLVLHRSDYNCHPDADPIGMQVGTYGLSHWAPLVGGGAPARPGDTYNFRSAWCGGIPFSLFHACGFGNAPIAPAPDYPIEWHRRMIEDYCRVRTYYTGDFYPLTGCSTSDREWFAYQMDRPDLGEGVVVALRRPKSPFEKAVFLLQGLTDADYELTDLDSGAVRKVSGKNLKTKGVTVTMKKLPDSVVLTYRKLTTPRTHR
ncbi:MAG: alpha-galactosidase [bacterium]